MRDISWSIFLINDVTDWENTESENSPSDGVVTVLTVETDGSTLKHLLLE